jgi:hypothetical protein
MAKMLVLPEEVGIRVAGVDWENSRKGLRYAGVEAGTFRFLICLMF